MDGYDLSFRRVGPEPGGEEDEEDWDFTDEDGRYKVELRSGRYDVLDESAGSLVTSVTVEAWQQEVLLDIDLPSED